MDSYSVEYQRFGDATGVIRLSDRYLRSTGNTAPTEQAHFGLNQENLQRALTALDYDNFERNPGRADAVRATADQVIRDLAPYLQRFLLEGLPPLAEDELSQVEVVTRALELAQLPFEILEESNPNLVVTRRVRQPWPAPKVNHPEDHVPKVLFAWAEPAKRAGSSRRMEVPFERHRGLLAEVLADWGGSDVVEEVENATRARILEAVTTKGPFTHIHLLAHGVAPATRAIAPGGTVNLEERPPPPVLVALENSDGTLDQCPAEELGEILKRADRPESIALATCHSSEVDPISSGGTLAHALHRCGAPVVLASQLALTKDGSDELIRTFLARVVNGDDPRKALRDCRDALRARQDETYFDRVALVGYIHIDGNLAKRLQERRFKVALNRLNAISKSAERQVGSAPALTDEKAMNDEQRAAAEEIRRSFNEVRDELAQLDDDPELSSAQRGELHGLRGSSLKRKAEAAWKLSQVLGDRAAAEWRAASHEALEGAARAYLEAAQLSRDHHWSWVQWLVLRAVEHGSLRDVETDWVTACAAAYDTTARTPRDESERARVHQDAIWAWGSLCELELLAPLVGKGARLDAAKRCLNKLVEGVHAGADKYAVVSTATQLARYTEWWGADPAWKLPEDIIRDAQILHAHLTERAGKCTGG